MSSRLDAFTIGADCANGAEVRRASDWLEAACLRHDVPQAPSERLVICLNEALANIITHGGVSALCAPIKVLFVPTREQDCHKASVTVTDAGMPYDPVSAPQKILPKTLADATEGGLGLVMIRRCADWLDYRHADGRNQFTFGARWS